MIFRIFKSPHILVESLAYKQTGTSSKVNPKLQICGFIYRVIPLGLVWDMSVLGECLHIFAWTKSGWKQVGNISVEWNKDEIYIYELLSYL